jgi:antitoxin component YwqK of YwqJK toxin-antitoxin module
MSNTYYESGQVKTSVEMEGKLMDGAYIEYYENGIVKVKGQYKKGVKTGTWKYYSPNGVIEKRDKPNNTEEDNMSFWDKILGRNKE